MNNRAKRLAQLDFFKMLDGRSKTDTRHGGVRSSGRRKIRRPIAVGRSLHVILKSSKAKGELSFWTPQNRLRIQNILRTASRRFGVRIEDFANSGNHLHLRVRTENRDAFRNFLRTSAALIARGITGARKGRPFGKFWDNLAFSRILLSSRELAVLESYFEGNRIEMNAGLLAREAYLKIISDLRRMGWIPIPT